MDGENNGSKPYDLGGFSHIFGNTHIYIYIYKCVYTLVFQIPCEKVFRYPKPTPKLLAEGSSEHKGYILFKVTKPGLQLLLEMTHFC